MTAVKEVDMQRLGELRTASQKVSQMLAKRLSSYLATLSPLFAPRKVLGEFMDSAFTEKVPGADKNFGEIEEAYKAIAKDTFGLPAKLGAPVPNVRNHLVIYPWEYRYGFDGDGGQPVTISSPVRWVLAYGGDFTLSNLMEHRAAGTDVSADDIKGLMIRSLTLWKLLENGPAICQLLADLRFTVSVERSPVAGDLPFMVISADVPVFRPQDDVIQMVTQLSGKLVFEELIDTDTLDQMTDPFRAQIEAQLA